MGKSNDEAARGRSRTAEARRCQLVTVVVRAMNAQPATGSRRAVLPGMWQQLGQTRAGLVSFSGLPFLTEPENLDDWQPEVAIVGAPYDGGAGERPGARYGPFAIRSQPTSAGSHSIDLDVSVFDWLNVVDYGDAVCSPLAPSEALENIQRRVTDVVQRGVVPVVLGGDHSISVPALTAVADYHGHGNVGVIHFDAHTDTIPQGTDWHASHASPFWTAITKGLIRGENLIQIGLRGFGLSRELRQWNKDHGVAWHTMQEVWEEGLRAVVDRVLAEAHTRDVGAWYLTVDIDVLDPAFAPGTGTPEPGGLTTIELTRAVRAISQSIDLVAMDIVEVSPPYDVSDLASLAAHRVVMEFLAGLAWKRKKRFADRQKSRQANVSPIDSESLVELGS